MYLSEPRSRDSKWGNGEKECRKEGQETSLLPVLPPCQPETNAQRGLWSESQAPTLRPLHNVINSTSCRMRRKNKISAVLSDVAYVLENDAEGIGLFRSEFFISGAQ